MKYLMFTIVLVFTCFSYGQDSTEIQLETPKIVSKLFFGKQIEIGDFEIRFVEVMSDSRCPKNVNCVRAGEAKAIVEVHRDGEFVEKRIIEITPSTYSNNTYPIVFDSGKTTLKAFDLIPYPIYGVAIKKEDYYLQLVIDN